MRSPEAVADTTWVSAWPVRSDALRAVKLLTTTPAVRADPSWNLMFGRRVRVQVSKVEFGVQDSARYGWMVPLAAMAMSGS